LFNFDHKRVPYFNLPILRILHILRILGRSAVILPRITLLFFKGDLEQLAQLDHALIWIFFLSGFRPPFLCFFSVGLPPSLFFWSGLRPSLIPSLRARSREPLVHWF